MVAFKDSSRGVLEALRGAFRYLYRDPPRGDRALKILARCGAHAQEMAETAGTLAGGFGKLADNAEAVLEGTLTERDMQEQERQAAVKRQAELKALNAEAKFLKEQLGSRIGEVQSLADEARSAQSRAEDRAFGLAIMSGITSAISTGVSAYASYQMAPLNAAAGVAGGLTGKDTAPAGGTSTGTADATATKDTASPTSAQSPDPAKLSSSTSTSEPAGSGTGQSDGAASDGPGSGMSTRDVAAAAAAAAEAGQSIAQTGKEMSGSYDEIATRYADERREYLKQLNQLKEKQREALGKIAEYAERMKTASTDATTAAAAVDSLQQAVAALKQIVTVLESAKFFWQLVAKACERLVGDEISQDIELIAEDAPADRLAEYQDVYFKQNLVRLAARWYALELIAEDYQDGVTKAREAVSETIKKAPSIEEARKLAPELGRKLSLDVAADLAALSASDEAPDTVAVAAE